MTNEEKLVVAKLLRVAISHFESEACLVLSKVMPKREDRHALIQKYRDRVDSLEEFNPDWDYSYFEINKLMILMILILEEEGGRSRPLGKIDDFKVGDRVMVEEGYANGQEGVVGKYEGDPVPLAFVDLDCGVAQYFDPKNLQKVEVSDRGDTNDQS